MFLTQTQRWTKEGVAEVFWMEFFRRAEWGVREGHQTSTWSLFMYSCSRSSEPLLCFHTGSFPATFNLMLMFYCSTDPLLVYYGQLTLSKLLLSSLCSPNILKCMYLDQEINMFLGDMPPNSVFGFLKPCVQPWLQLHNLWYMHSFLELPSCPDHLQLKNILLKLAAAYKRLGLPILILIKNQRLTDNLDILFKLEELRQQTLTLYLSWRPLKPAGLILWDQDNIQSASHQRLAWCRSISLWYEY